MKKVYFIILSFLMTSLAVEADSPIRYFKFLEQPHMTVTYPGKYSWIQQQCKAGVISHVFENGDTLYAYLSGRGIMGKEGGDYVRVSYKDKGIYEGYIKITTLSVLKEIGRVPKEYWTWGTFYRYADGKSLPCVYGIVSEWSDRAVEPSGKFREQGSKQTFYHPIRRSYGDDESSVTYIFDSKTKSLKVTHSQTYSYEIPTSQMVGKVKTGGRPRMGSYGFVGGYTIDANAKVIENYTFNAGADALSMNLTSVSQGVISYKPDWSTLEVYANTVAGVKSEMARVKREIAGSTLSEIRTAKAQAAKSFANFKQSVAKDAKSKSVSLHQDGLLLIVKDNTKDEWDVSAYTFLLNYTDGAINRKSGVFTGENTINGYEYVDMGFPSGTLWATCNLGSDACFTSRQYTGFLDGLFGKPERQYTELEQAIAGVEQRQGIVISSTDKGNKLSDLQVLRKTVTEVPPKYDLSTQVMGDEWHRPTDNQWREIRDKALWTLERYEGTTGYRVVGPNGNSIFLPIGQYWAGGLEHMMKFDTNNIALFPNEPTDRRMSTAFLRPVAVKTLTEEEKKVREDETLKYWRKVTAIREERKNKKKK